MVAAVKRFYGDDLASIHDAGFGHSAAGAAPGLLRIMRKHGITAGRVVDLGCGSGIWARALLDAGYEVHGVDASRAMVARARRRAPSGTFRARSLWNAAIPRCDAVTAIGECLNYGSGSENARAGRDRLFRRIAGALRPGGLFVFDLVESGWAPGPAPRETGRSGPAWAVTVVSLEKGKILTRRITSFRRVGRLYRRREEVHTLRLYRRDAIASQLRRSGFTVRIIRAYGTMKLPAFHVAFLARRR